MNEFKNALSALPDGFSAVSMDELKQIEGGVVIAIIAILIGFQAPVVRQR